MKRHSGIFYIFLMCIIAFSASMAGYISGVRATGQRMRQQTRLSAPSPFVQSRAPLPMEDTIPIINADTEITTTYILRDKDGKLALFSKYSDGKESLSDGILYLLNGKSLSFSISLDDCDLCAAHMLMFYFL